MQNMSLTFRQAAQKVVELNKKLQIEIKPFEKIIADVVKSTDELCYLTHLLTIMEEEDYDGKEKFYLLRRISEIKSKKYKEH
jgi:hypothetical protein